LGSNLQHTFELIADENALLKGIIDRVDLNATTHGVRDIDDNRLSNLIEAHQQEIVKNDFNISPSRYIHTGAGEEYRPIAEIVEELEALEAESRVTDAALKKILARLGV
jgi:type I restriction-modification system DNA methylase subunit